MKNTEKIMHQVRLDVLEGLAEQIFFCIMPSIMFFLQTSAVAGGL